MSKIKINFDDVPDEILPLPTGIYTFIVKDCKLEEVEAKGNKPAGEMVLAILQVDDEGNAQNGRQHYERFYLNNQYGPVLLKKFAKSTGITAGKDGIDCSDLIGKHCKARMLEGTYKDPETGETKPNSRIKEWLF